jgi:ADP-ribose pyrophosphatase YjhB (NUDIX family)
LNQENKSGDKKYRDPVPSIDLVVRKGNQILVERRGREPFKGFHCLPGGHVDYGETVEACALRELKEETTVDGKLVGILGVYSDPTRDPRGQRVTVVFIADWISGTPVGQDDALSAEWMNEAELQNPGFPFAFDHALLLKDYFSWKKFPTETYWSSKSRG